MILLSAFGDVPAYILPDTDSTNTGYGDGTDYSSTNGPNFTLGGLTTTPEPFAGDGYVLKYCYQDATEFEIVLNSYLADDYTTSADSVVANGRYFPFSKRYSVTSNVSNNYYAYRWRGVRPDWSLGAYSQLEIKQYTGTPKLVGARGNTWQGMDGNRGFNLGMPSAFAATYASVDIIRFAHYPSPDNSIDIWFEGDAGEITALEADIVSVQLNGVDIFTSGTGLVTDHSSTILKYTWISGATNYSAFAAEFPSNVTHEEVEFDIGLS